MKFAKFLLSTVVTGFFAGANVNYSLAQAQKEQEKSQKEKELIAQCKTKLIKNDPPREAKDWKETKGETYHNPPLISYFIEEGGKVTNVKLKRSSGVRKVDEYAIEWAKGRKYKPMPGCPGIETTESVIIDFQ